MEEGWGPGARRRALLGALACCAWEKMEGEGRKKEGKRKMERERKRERAIGGIRGGGRRTRTAASVGSNSHAERGIEEHKDGD